MVCFNFQRGKPTLQKMVTGEPQKSLLQKSNNAKNKAKTAQPHKTLDQGNFLIINGL